MNGIDIAGDSISLIDLLVGVLILLAIVLKLALGRLGIPALVAFLLLGILLRVADHNWDLVSRDGEQVLAFLASIGVIVLLFRVGLESNLHDLVGKLPRAAPIWLGNVVLSGIAGYVAARYLLGLSSLASLFAATALTATSVAVSLEPWRDADMLTSADGELLTDVAGLDDVSAIALMAMLIAIVPAMLAGSPVPIDRLLAEAGLVFLMKALVFGALCLLLAYLVQHHIATVLRSAGSPNALLMMIGISIVIAALAGALGFSLAIGALFAGLLFSRNAEAVRMETMFEPVASLFAPFFFIGIGMQIDVASLLPALGVGLVLLVFAVAGKVLGAGLPALFSTGWTGAAAIGVSMVPRAEIAMVVMYEGQRLSPIAVPPVLYGAMILVSVLTCMASPFVIRKLLVMHPHNGN